MPEGDRPVSNNLIDLAPPDIAWFQERSDIVLVPIGSREQHGAHLPLGTDTITALEVSRRAAAIKKDGAPDAIDEFRPLRVDVTRRAFEDRV